MIFLIGGNGLVGSAFARVLAAEGRKFAILDRQSYRDHVGQACELLINANGNSRKPLAVKDPLADFDASVRSVRCSLADFRFERYLHLSSCDVYADCSSPGTTREDQPLDVPGQSPYGFHKYMAEQCVRHAARDWLIFRLGGFVGPGLKKNAIYDIAHGGPLWLDPESELQFLSTDAAARMMLDIAGRGIGREVINFCGKGVISLRQAMERTGIYVAANPGSPRVRYDVSIEKASRWVEIPGTAETVIEFLKAAATPQP